MLPNAKVASGETSQRGAAGCRVGAGRGAAGTVSGRRRSPAGGAPAFFDYPGALGYTGGRSAAGLFFPHRDGTPPARVLEKRAARRVLLGFRPEPLGLLALVAGRLHRTVLENSAVAAALGDGTRGDKVRDKVEKELEQWWR